MQESILEQTKRCSCCREVKPHSAFSKRKARPDGLQYSCKGCKAVQAKTEHAKSSQRAYASSAEGRASHKLSVEKYNESNKDKQRSRGAVGHALKMGVLIRPSACSDCGDECVPQAHHTSYEEHMKLQVVWLCAPCHKLEHKRIDKERV
jgi:hypothetical protein